MSIDMLWQICHKKGLDNSSVSLTLVKILKEDNKFAVKKVARELDVDIERVRHWYYRATGMNASDLLKFLYLYNFVETEGMGTVQLSLKEHNLWRP